MSLLKVSLDVLWEWKQNKILCTKEENETESKKLCLQIFAALAFNNKFLISFVKMEMTLHNKRAWFYRRKTYFSGHLKFMRLQNKNISIKNKFVKRLEGIRKLSQLRLIIQHF